MRQFVSFLLAFVLVLCAVGCQTVQTPPDALPEQPPEPAPVIQKEPEEPELQEGSETQEGQFVFTRENFPKLDGSTSTVPLAQAMAAILLSEEQEQVEDLVKFSRTSNSYNALMDYIGQADLLLAAEPSDEVLKMKQEMGFEWVKEPFAIDGLVFVVDENNPVDSLTVEQVQKIYTGEITNWSEVGGDDVEIIPFQRNEDAGSQTMMQKLVMGAQPMMKAPLAYVSDSMGSLMDAIKEYDHSAGAIGYSVYYYANDMRKAEGLKILKINDVKPGADSFRDKSYPFTNPYYVVMKAGLPNTDPTQMLFHWLLSEVGQWFVEYMGYVPVSAPKDPFSPDTIPSTAYCDWSYLKAPDSAELSYERYWPEPQSTLIPHDDYGLLLPFIGKELAYSYMVDYRYGLATQDGKVVVEPYYDMVSVLDTKPFVYALREPVADEEIAKYNLAYAGKWLWSVAAQDGTWCLPLQYILVVTISQDTILLVDQDGILWLCDPEGNLTEFPLDKNAAYFWGMDWKENLSVENYNYFDGVDKVIEALRAAGAYPESAGETSETSAADARLEVRKESENLQGVYDLAKESWVIPPMNAPMYVLTDAITNEPYIIVRENVNDFYYGDYILYTAAGEYLLKSEVMPKPINGIFTLRDGEWSGLIDKNGSWIMRFPLQSNTD